MAVTAFLFGQAFMTTFNKEADWDTDTAKTTLHTSSFTPNQDTLKYYADAGVTNELTTTGGYTATGVTISPLTIAYTGGTNIFNITGSNAAWTSATFTARVSLVYDSTPANKPLLSYVDFGADQTVASATFTIAWAAAGIATITLA